MNLLNGIVFRLLPSSLTHNIYFIAAVAVLYAALSCAMAFIKDPRFGRLAKYNDPLELVVKELGWLNDKEKSVSGYSFLGWMGVLAVVAGLAIFLTGCLPALTVCH